MNANKTALFAALNKVVNGRTAFIHEVVDAGYLTAEQARPDVMEYVSIHSGCPLKTQGSGRTVFDDSTGKAASARNALRDLMNWLQGMSRRDAVAKASPAVGNKATPLTKAQKAAIAALLKAFGGDRKAAKAAV